MNSCGARCAGTNGTARIKIPTSASDPARTRVSARAALAPGRVAARTPQNMKIAPSATTPPGREGSPIRPVAASKINNAPSSSTMNSLSSRKRLLGAAMYASFPRAIIRQAADGCNRASTGSSVGRWFRRGPRWRRGCGMIQWVVWFAALVCSIESLGENSVHKVIIIGSGCAGLTAAIYAARADLAPLVLDGYEPGGQLALTTMVENFPGFPDGILGPELIENSRKQAQRFGTEFQSGAVTSVDLSRRPFTVVAGKETYQTESLIVAAGASARMLGIESERHLLGHGVSTCATCDGFFFRGKDIIVVGGGDTAMEEATFLTKFARKVTLIHRRNEFRATKIMLDRAHANEKIEFLTPYVIEEVHDVNSKSVEKVRIRNTDNSETRELETSGVFVAIGHDPNTKLFTGQLAMDENGYLITHDGPKTNIEGVFAAGDVQDHHYRQAITAAGSGCMAAIEAERFLEGHKG